MKQVHIKCTCRSIRLPDLQLSLIQGQEVVVSEESAKKSKDLATAVRYKGVQVQYVTICAVQRADMDAPPVRTTPPWKPIKVIPSTPSLVPSPSQTVPTPPIIDTTAIAQEILSKLGSILTPQSSGVLNPVVAGTVKESEPARFIPEGLVGKASGSIAIEAVETENDQVAAASRALRNRKRKKDG